MQHDNIMKRFYQLIEEALDTIEVKNIPFDKLVRAYCQLRDLEHILATENSNEQIVRIVYEQVKPLDYDKTSEETFDNNSTFTL